MNFNLTINFNSIGDLKSFVEDIDQMEITKLKKIFKKTQISTGDKRGNKTKFLHEKAKEYKLNNINVTYKEALKIVGQQITDEKTIIKDIQEENVSDTAELIEQLTENKE